MNLRLVAPAALLLTVVLTGCGGDGDATATDASPTEATSSTATPSASVPTVAPKPGSLPAFPATDYAYTLQQRCFCAFVDAKYRITVEDGEVTSVAWATKGEGHEVGDEVADAAYLRLTIQDIIDLGNDTKAAQVTVDWPAGQAYPNSVYIDKNKMVADEEVTWVVSDVETA